MIESMTIKYVFLAIVMVYSPIGIPEHRIIWREHGSMEDCYAEKDRFNDYVKVKNLQAQAFCAQRGRES